jgi:ankyrin repeat protein
MFASPQKILLKPGIRCMLTLLALFPSLGWGAPSGKELLNALRNGDTAVISGLIRTGAPVDAVDEFGSSALMYAVLDSDVAIVRLLLDRGANPNHSDNAGATALIWAIPDEAKVRLLLERGARVDVKSKLSGRTPLLIASGRPGAAAVVRLLLEKGADPKARDNKGETTLIRAASSGDPRILRLLVDHAVDVNAGAGDDKFKFTALMVAAAEGNSEMVEMLLARGADSKIRDEAGFTTVNFAKSYRDFNALRLLIAKGADPSIRNLFGQDLMMAAAASDSSTPEVIREIAMLRVDPKLRAANLHTQQGFPKDPESPLDWASRHGDTPVTRLLAELTGDQPRPAPSGESPRLKAKTPRAAIEKALPLLYEGGREFIKRSGCTSCHHNVLPALAFSHARAKGIVLDGEKVRRTTCNRSHGSRVHRKSCSRISHSQVKTLRPHICCLGSKRMATAGTAPRMLSYTTWPRIRRLMEDGERAPIVRRSNRGASLQRQFPFAPFGSIRFPGARLTSTLAFSALVSGSLSTAHGRARRKRCACWA